MLFIKVKEIAIILSTFVSDSDVSEYNFLNVAVSNVFNSKLKSHLDYLNYSLLISLFTPLQI